MTHLEEAVDDFRIRQYVDGRITLSLNMSPSCQTPLNGCSTSKKTEVLQVEGGGYSVNESVILLDGGVEEAKAIFVIGD